MNQNNMNEIINGVLVDDAALTLDDPCRFHRTRAD